MARKLSVFSKNLLAIRMNILTELLKLSTFAKNSSAIIIRTEWLGSLSMFAKNSSAKRSVYWLNDPEAKRRFYRELTCDKSKHTMHVSEALFLHPIVPVVFLYEASGEATDERDQGKGCQWSWSLKVICGKCKMPSSSVLSSSQSLSLIMCPSYC